MCKIGRLTLGDELKDGHQPTMVEEEEGYQSKLENKVKEWELERTHLRRAHEAVISACPYKIDKQSNGTAKATELIPSEFEGANGNKRFCGENELNQSTGSRIEREQP